ncbi:MAG: hypothetical protein ACXACX_11420 [Candidatus Hodarchaeales archaeon]|jgi:hypothetical protein
MDYLLSVIGTIFSFFSVGIVFILTLKNRTIPIFKLIVLGQFFFLGLTASLTIFSILDSSYPKELVSFVHRMGMLSGHLGTIVWFLIFDRIEYEHLHERRIFFQRILVFLIGISYATNFLTIDYSVSGSSWIISYLPIGIILLLVVYGSFTLYQYILFFQRIKQHIGVTNFPKISAFLYFSFMALAIILFVVGGQVFNLPFLWVFFGGIAQFFISYLFVMIPRVLLTNETPIVTMILSKGGTLLYSFNFSKKLSFEKELIGGFLTALDTFGTQVLDQSSAIESIKYKSQIVLMKLIGNIRFSYMYQGASYYAPFRLEQFIQILQNQIEIWEKIQTASFSNTLTKLEEGVTDQINKYSQEIFS